MTTRTKLFSYSVLCFFWGITPLFSLCLSDFHLWPTKEGHELYLGPEIDYAFRNRDGGKISGPVIGDRGGYDYIAPFRLYMGAEAFYGSGILTGRSRSNSKQKSHFNTFSIEGRLGYTFAQTTGYKFSISPFVGGGYLEERTNFVSPSPLQIHFKTYLSYFTAGFLSQMSWNSCWDTGINFKVRVPYDTRNKTSNDPKYKPTTMLVKNENQYVLELPITYKGLCWSWLQFVPFFEYRHYGEQPNFPFDFLDTEIEIYGLTFKFLKAF